MDLLLPSTTVSIADDELDFKMVEQIFSEIAKRFSCTLMLDWLRNKDEELFVNHDRSKLINKGFKKRTILTLMGAVTFMRRMYRDKATNTDRYLLDEAIGLSKKVGIAGSLAELSMWLATGASYGKASRELEMLVGERVSKQAIWNLVQERGKKLAAELSESREAVFSSGVGTVVEELLNGEWECPAKIPLPITVIQTKESRLSHKTLPVHPVTMPIFVGPHQGHPWVKTLKTRITIGAA